MDAPGDRDSREWLLGPRARQLEPWQEAVEHLPGAAAASPPSCASPDTPHHLGPGRCGGRARLWDVLQQLVKEYDAGAGQMSVRSPVLDGTGHLAVIGDGGV